MLADENLGQLTLLAARRQELQEQACTKQSQNSSAPAPAPSTTPGTATTSGGPIHFSQPPFRTY